MNTEAPTINNETNHFHYEVPIGYSHLALFIVMATSFCLFSLGTLLVGIFLKMDMMIYMGILLFVILPVMLYLMNLNLRKYVIDINAPKNEMVIQHLRLPIYCCCKNEKHTIYPLRDVVTFSYSPSFSELATSTFTVSVRNGAIYESKFSIPMEQILRINAILKLVNPALINERMNENTRIFHIGNYRSYSSNPYVHAPANNIPSNTPAANVAGNNVMAPVSSAPVSLTADQLGLLINQLQSQQLILQQQEQQRLGQGEGCNASVPGMYPPPPSVSLPVGISMYVSSPQMNTYTNVGADAQQGSGTETWIDINK